MIKEIGSENDENNNDTDSNYLEDLATHGAASGFPGLTYYKDTCALYDRYTEELWEALCHIAENWDGNSILEMISSCTASKAIDSDTTLKNFIVWLVAEHYAAEYLLNREESDDE